MARYRGPKAKIARRFKEPIFGPSKALEKKNYGPGQHGNSRRRGKQSEYAIQLAEKQKAKYTYGVLEKQFALTFDKAARKKGITGENLLKFLEARLDNTVFRLGIAPTRRSARQLVGHRHIRVNGIVTNVASFQMKPGDVIEVREKSKSLELITDSLAGKKSFTWLDWNAAEYKGTFLNYPERSDIPENIKEQLIVELYSK
ncbi:MAG TPA: 30S ribosomal protein S4 [Bacteroidetes bacterium]|jgi:small subunit ribosomal protein S4|nr:30S ribosomal protein S4 [Bacteroidota bacterium]